MNWITLFFALAAGAVVSVQAGSNAQLKQSLGSPILALVVNYVLGFGGIGAAALIARSHLHNGRDRANSLVGMGWRVTRIAIRPGGGAAGTQNGSGHSDRYPGDWSADLLRYSRSFWMDGFRTPSSLVVARCRVRANDRRPDADRKVLMDPWRGPLVIGEIPIALKKSPGSQRTTIGMESCHTVRQKIASKVR